MIVEANAMAMMVELNQYFAGKDGKLDEKKTMNGKQFWDMQTRVWTETKKAFGVGQNEDKRHDKQTA